MVKKSLIPNRILILKEKHCTRHIYVPTDEILFAFCLKLVNERNVEGYYNDLTCLKEPEEPQKPIDYDNQPQYVQQLYTSKLKAYKSDLKDYQYSLEDIDFLKRSLEDGQTAYDFLKSRYKYEYEEIELVCCDVL